MDNIDTYILKLVVDEILPAMTHVINLSIQQSVFPSTWKVAKVIPLFKKGDSLEPKNYRPVAILVIMSKVLERIIFQQVIEYMDSFKLLNPNHHGFRSHHSTSTAMIQMYDTWVEAVDRGELAGVCMLDMSAAFDVVDPELLLQKLQLYGFDDGAVEWMKNYLTNRSQSVYIDGSLSSPLDVEVGVPQGSILGPLCYIIFTNDLPETIHEDTVHDENSTFPKTHCSVCGGLCCFADDSTYSVGEGDQDILSGKLTEKYKVIANYMTNNRLKLNDDKTHLLVMSTQQKRARGNIHVSISTPTETIQPIKSEKLLGIHIHENMKWSEYVQDNDQSLIKQLTSRLSALKITSRLASFKVRLMVANGIFCSKLIYGIALWGGCELGLLGSLQIIQNKAARFVTRRYRDEDEHYIAL